MRTWWIGAAVTAIWLGQVATAAAQSPGGPLPEPAPVAPCPPTQPPAVSGPLTGAGAPMGPGLDLSLPATVPTAWGPGPMPESGFFFSLGAVSYQRQRPGRTPFVLRDNTGPDTDVPIGTPNGTPFLRNTTPVLNFGDLNPAMGWGLSGSFGYMFDDAALEVAGFYVPNNSSQIEARHPGRLFLFFHEPPVGLEGDNGMWRQADRVVATLTSELSSGELNYRWWSRSHYGLEGILGVRYFGINEKIAIFTDDDGLLVNDVTNRPDPNRQATVSVRSHNRLVAAQAGFEGYLPVFKWAGIGTIAKGAWGPNFLTVDHRITRGDLFVGRSERRDDVIFSHLYEISAFADIFLWEKIRLRAGYNVMWALGVNEAIRQIDYDLLQPGPHKNDGSIFYHGPMIELHLIF